MTDTDTSIEREARRRAGAKLGWYIHAGVYIAVNLFLIALATLSGRNWAIFPVLGWGIGLAVHGVVVFVVTGGGGLLQRMVEQERATLQQRDPW